MKLLELCREAVNITDCEIRSVTDDTEAFQKGDVFVCIKGENFDGHNVAAKILDEGAAAVVVERDLGLPQQIIVEDSRRYFSLLAGRYYKDPTKNLKLIAVTGTNGKSTTISLIQFILTELGHKCGSIGTVGYDVCGKIYEARLTTPRPMELYRYFREMADNGAEYCVLETSSQALAQQRFDNETVECAVFTNLTQDHLDYHGSMDKYYKAKRMLFDMCRKAVISIDDKYGQKLEKYVRKNHDIPICTYSTEDMADFFAINIKAFPTGVSYWLNSATFEKSFHISLNMPGKYNISNSLAAVAATTQLGMKINDVVEAVQKNKGLIGRGEVIYSGKFTVIRDYAHTADALEKFLSATREYAKGNILCLFGAAGERDRDKRPAMGETAARYSDYLVVTSDNPRFEDEEKIIKDVLIGVEKNSVAFETHTDRLEGIKAILKRAKEGDIVLLCGKGHETYQVLKDEYLPFDEKEIVNSLLMQGG